MTYTQVDPGEHAAEHTAAAPMSWTVHTETPQEAAEREARETTDLITAEDAVEIAVYAANAPECCNAGDRLDAILGMLGANVMDDTVYHDADAHGQMRM